MFSDCFDSFAVDYLYLDYQLYFDSTLESLIVSTDLILYLNCFDSLVDEQITLFEFISFGLDYLFYHHYMENS